MTHRNATWAVIIAASLWGTTGTVAYFLGGALSPIAIGAVTMGVGGAILALIGKRLTLRVWQDPSVRRWVILGSLGVAVYPLAFYTGMDLAGVAVGNILTLGTGPLVGALLEWLIDKRTPATTWWWALSLGVAGVLALSFGEHSETSADPELFSVGVVVALIAGVAYGLFSYAMGRVMDHGHSPRATAGAVFGAGAIPLLVVVAFAIPELSDGGSALWGLGYLVLFPMVVAYVLYSQALRDLLSSTVLAIALVEPAVATVLAVAIVGERFDYFGAVGLALVVLAVWFASRSQTMRNAPSST